jgi:hypothetical protein
MNVQNGKWYERYAWILLFVMGLLLVVVGTSYIAMGLPERPVHEAAFRDGRVYAPPLLEQSPPQLSVMFGQVMRSWGIFELGFGIFVMATTWFRFRKGDRWAWFVLWLLPAAMLAELLNVLWAGMIVGPLPIFLFVSVLGLVLPYRQFFRYDRQQTVGHSIRPV